MVRLSDSSDAGRGDGVPEDDNQEQLDALSRKVQEQGEQLAESEKLTEELKRRLHALHESLHAKPDQSR